MSRRRTGTFALAAVSALAIAGPASAGSTIETKLKFIDAVSGPEPNVLTFLGKVKSNSNKCIKDRKIRFAKRPGSSNGSFTPVGSTTSDNDGKWAKNLDVNGGPDFKVSTRKVTVGSKTCGGAAILLEE